MRKFNPAEVGARLKEAREALGLKQVDVAAKIGVQPPQWNRFEKGERLITPEAAKAFGDAYGFDLNFVFVGSEAGVGRLQALAAIRSLRQRGEGGMPQEVYDLSQSLPPLTWWEG